MADAPRTRLEVWGDPIEHSLSPTLHLAAYRALGLEWRYGRRRVPLADFSATLASLDERWRGLSLTYPLKTAAYAAARTHDRRATLTAAVNTLVFGPDGPHGFNTDVGGIVRALGEQPVASADRARIIGAGATATSALVALMFGTRWMAMLYGFVFFSHQVGGFLGAWMGGVLFERTGSYDIVWWLSVLFGVLSALLNLPIVERPVARMAAQPA